MGLNYLLVSEEIAFRTLNEHELLTKINFRPKWENDLEFSIENICVAMIK